MDRTVIATENAPPAVGPYSQGIQTGNLIFTAGQVGLDPATRKLVEGGVQAQAHQALKNLNAVLEAAGSNLHNAVKVTVFLADMGDYTTVNEIYATYFGDTPPARSAVQVGGLPLGGLVEIEVVALLP